MNQKQIDLLEKLGIKYDPDRRCTAEELAEIEDKVGNYLTLQCLDEGYEPNEEGRICESILDMIDTI